MRLSNISRKIRVDLKESKLKESTLSKDKMHGKPAWVCLFCGKSRHIRPNCYKLQAAKRANKPKVPVPQAQDPIALIGGKGAQPLFQSWSWKSL